MGILVVSTKHWRPSCSFCKFFLPFIFHPAAPHSHLEASGERDESNQQHERRRTMVCAGPGGTRSAQYLSSSPLLWLHLQTGSYDTRVSKPKGTQFSRVLILIMASAFMKTKKHTHVCQTGSFCFIERQMILCFMCLSHSILLFFVILFVFF